MKRSTVIIAIVAVAAAPSCSAEMTSRQESDGFVSSPATTPDPMAAHDRACSLVDIAHSSDYLVDLTPIGSVERAQLRFWLGESRSEAELQAIPRRDVSLLKMRIDKIVARREVGPRVALVRELAPDAEWNVIGVGVGTSISSDSANPVRALVTTFEGERGPVLNVVAIVSDSSSPTFVDASDCTEGNNAALRRLNDPAEIFSRMVTETFTSTKLDALLIAADKPPSLTGEEEIAAQEESWRATPVETRPLQFGEVPRSLKGSVRVAGLLVAVADEIDPRDAPLGIVLWSDLGVSSEVIVPSGAGASAVVIPEYGELYVSVRQKDGSLGEPLARIPSATLSGEYRALLLRVEVESVKVSASALSDEQFAEGAHIEVKALNGMEQAYASQIFFQPSGEG